MPGIEIKGRSKIANYRHGGRTGKFGGGRTNLLEQLGRVEAEPSNPNRRAEISRVHGELNRGYAKGGRAGFVHGSVAKVAKIAARKFRKPPGVFKIKGKKTHGKDVPTMAAEGGRAGFAHGTDRKIRVEPSKYKKFGAKRVPGRKRKYESYTTDAGQLMVPMFNTSGQFRGYKEKKQTSYKKRNLEPELVRHIDKDKPTPVRSSRMDEERPEEVKSKWPARTKAKRSPTHPDDLRPEQAEGRRIGLKKGTDKKWIQKAVDPKHKGYCTPMTKKTCTPARKALARTFKKKAKTGWG